MNLTNEIREHYLNSFKLVNDAAKGTTLSPVHILRQQGIDDFLSVGFPTNTDEEWRFTNITPLARTMFHLPQSVPSNTTPDLNGVRELIPEIDGSRLIFINGIYNPTLSTPRSSTPEIENLASILRKKPDVVSQFLNSLNKSEKNPFDALNTGFLSDGTYIVIPDNFHSAKPIYCLFIATETPEPALIQLRNIFIVGKNCKASVIEHYISLADNSYFTNTVSQITVAENSFVEHTKIQMEGVNAFHVGSLRIQQQSGSNVISHSIMIGGSIARNNVTSQFNGENAECTMNGLTLAKSKQLIDNHTTIDHAQPRCSSHELFKSILDGDARGVFNGKIYVRKDAQKTNAKQTNKTLLLSDLATMDTKPQLEIFADDVKCTHGATIGYLDSEMLFYLRSRGISKEEARDLLIHAFASDVTERVSSPIIREYLDRIILKRLHRNNTTVDHP
jgi:Fe-S cluster assembly protein SufD